MDAVTLDHLLGESVSGLRGRTVRRWDRIHHYFGGVSCVGLTGAAGDPRRSGAAIVF